jgi:elongation factor 1-beta
MGEVALQYRILPESIDTDLNKLVGEVVAALPKGALMKAHELKPVAFGLKALHVLIVVDDKQGGAEQIEEAVSAVSGVQSIEIVEMGLL